MSPLAILYFLLASSPVYNNWRHESSSPSSSWARFPSTFDNVESRFGGDNEWTRPESSIFGGRFESMMPFESIFGGDNEWMTPSTFGGRTEEPSTFNWLLRKALRTCPVTGLSTRRSLVNELIGGRRHESSILSTMSPIFAKINLIKRIAEVNPILIEKLLTRPESRFAVESLLRTVEPESLLLVEKLIRKNVPTYLREKVARRVIKSLLTKSVMPRRSIASELFPTSFESTTPFSTLFNVEEPMLIKNLIEKLLTRSTRRHAEVAPEVVLSKVIRRLVKKSIRSHESPIELLSTLSHVEPKFAKKIEKVIRRLVKSSIYEPESIFTSSWEKKSPMKKIIKSIVKNLKNKNVRGEEEEIFCNACESICESESFEFSPISVMNKNKWTKKVCRVCNEVCPTMSWTSSRFAGRHTPAFFRPTMTSSSSVFGRHFDF